MFRLWLSFRRIRQRTTPTSVERGSIEVFLRESGAFGEKTPLLFTTFARNFCIAATVVLIISGSLSSYAYASDTVLPDTVLYPVRQAIEGVEAKLAVTPVQKEKVQQKLVARRKQEVQKLKELKRPVPVPLKKYLQVTPPKAKVAPKVEEKRQEVRAADKKGERVKKQEEKKKDENSEEKNTRLNVRPRQKAELKSQRYAPPVKKEAARKEAQKQQKEPLKKRIQQRLQNRSQPRAGDGQRG